MSDTTVPIKVARRRRLTVCNEAEAVRHAANADAIISIRDPGDTSLFEPSATTLELRFFDSSDPAGHYGGPALADVEAIVAFASFPADVTVVHCTYGQCRSTAAAIVLLLADGLPPAEAFRLAYWRRPNRTRDFEPNRLLLTHAAAVLALPGLLDEFDAWMRLPHDQ